MGEGNQKWFICDRLWLDARLHVWHVSPRQAGENFRQKGVSLAEELSSKEASRSVANTVNFC